MFVLHTRGGALRARLTQMEENLGLRQRIKYVETVGPTLGETLVRQDPWQMHCGRKECMPCATKPGKCMKQNITYSIECTTCKSQGIEARYWGESARTG